MVIDLDKCTGCGACMVACMAENNVPFREDDTDKLLSVSWMRVYRLGNGKPFPQVEECYLPRPCQQCEGHAGHSPCVSVCPATATDYDMQTGIVSQISTRCFGCRYCMAACPYHVRQFNWWDPIWPDGMERMLNPNVSVRMRGVVEKCSFCFHRYQLATDKAYAGGPARTGRGRIPDRLHPGLPGGRHPLRRPEQPHACRPPDRPAGQCPRRAAAQPEGLPAAGAAGHQPEGVLPVEQGVGAEGR